MKINTKSIILWCGLIGIFIACQNAPKEQTASKSTILPKTNNSINWEQNGQFLSSNTLHGVFETAETFSFSAQTVLHEKLIFNDIPLRVGVYHIGAQFDNHEDAFVGGRFFRALNKESLINQDIATLENKYCSYHPILEEDKLKNYMALTYVDTNRGIVQGKFKVRFEKKNGCEGDRELEILFEEGAFAVKLERG